MNNNPRIYLWIALALVAWLNYQAWMTDYGPKPGANTVASQTPEGARNPTGSHEPGVFARGSDFGWGMRNAP